MLKWLKNLFRDPLRESCNLHPPDIIEKRGDNTLHVWGSCAHWSVLDAEAAEFLAGLRETPALPQLLAKNSRWNHRKTEIRELITALAEAGVIVPESAPSMARPLFDGKPVLIENLAVNLTNQCNLRCRFCYQNSALVNSPSPGFSPEQFSRFLGQAAPLLATSPSLTILGGEPLLEQDKLSQIVRVALPRGFRPIVSTNGLLVTPSFAREAGELGLEVQVSLDGPTTAFHDAIRGAGTFDRTLSGIRILVDNGARTIVNMVCHEGNLATLADFFRLARSLGVREARFIPLKMAGGAQQSGLVPVPLPRLLRAATQLFQENPDFSGLAGRDALSILGNTARYSLKRPSCGSGLQTLLLDADGGLYPCLSCLSPPWRFGSITEPESDFSVTWRESPKLHAFRQSTSVVAEGNACRECPVKFWCLGGCRGETFAVKGNLAANSPFCNDLRRGILDSFWIVTDHPEFVPDRQTIC